MSVRTRLTLWYSGVVAVSFLLLGGALYYFISVATKSSIEQSLRQQANSVISEMKVIQFGSYQLVPFPELTDFKVAGTFMQFVSAAGEVRTNIPGRLRLPFDLKQDFQRAKTDRHWFTTIREADMTLLVYHTSLAYNDEIIGMLQAATEISDHVRFLEMLRYILLLSSLAALAVAATLGSYIARKSLRPIEDVIAAANRISSGEDLGQRIAHTGPKDEIGRLTETINSMLSRLETAYKELEEAYRNQRRFVADASHELRTPLTTIRGNVELLERMWKTGHQTDVPMSLEAMHDISTEAARMSRLVGDLLALARADAGQRIAKEPVEMGAVVLAVARKAELLPRNAEWQQGDLTAAHGTYVLGNEDYLQQLLFIFIDNAFKFTNEGYVRMEAMRLGGQLGIAVEDTGIGMDPHQIPQIFDRFYRADASRGETSGTGLGLSIAKWIIDEHGGSIEVFSRKQEGSRFVIWLPVIHNMDADVDGADRMV